MKHKKDIMPKKCKHRNTWILIGGHLEWCTDCGAFRDLIRFVHVNGGRPSSAWCRPGPNGDTYEQWEARSEQYRKRYGVDA